jgi:hypothetical protein
MRRPGARDRRVRGGVGDRKTTDSRHGAERQGAAPHAPDLRMAATTATLVPCHSKRRLSISSCAAKRFSSPWRLALNTSVRIARRTRPSVPQGCPVLAPAGRTQELRSAVVALGGVQVLCNDAVLLGGRVEDFQIAQEAAVVQVVRVLRLGVVRARHTLALHAQGANPLPTNPPPASFGLPSFGLPSALSLPSDAPSLWSNCGLCWTLPSAAGPAQCRQAPPACPSWPAPLRRWR